MSYLLTHIPKTAGTSLRKAVFDAHLESRQIHRFTGVRNALRSSESFDLLTGHYPCGVHWLYGIQNPRYFVMLREPVDRAVSHYYFIKACDSDSYQHPQLEHVKSKDLADLYKMPKYQNMQTRFVAGLHWQLLGRYASLNNTLGKLALRQAKHNLRTCYEAFGLKEQFAASLELFGERIGKPVQLPERTYKKTPIRPTVDDLPGDVVRQLCTSNALDIKLYEYAVRLFDSQL